MDGGHILSCNAKELLEGAAKLWVGRSYLPCKCSTLKPQKPSVRQGPNLAPWTAAGDPPGTGGGTAILETQ